MASDANRTPQYLVELAAAGELGPHRSRAVLEQAARERGGAELLAALRSDDAATLARLPPERVGAEVARRSPRRRRRRWLLVPVLAAAGAAASLVLVQGAARHRPTPEEDGTRVKGRAAPHLLVHRRTTSGAEVVAPGAPARPGDLLQLGYVAAPGFGVIVSIDGRGGVTRHWPAEGDEAGALTSGREVLLPESFRLDDAPSFERFILVTADRPFEVAPVLDAARVLAVRPDAREVRLPLAQGLSEASFVVSKEIR
jgi:hypothetical protein